MFAKLYIGDFLQLLPVPSSSPFIALWSNQVYKWQEGRKFFLDVQHVIEFTSTRRFVDPNLTHIL